MLKNDCELNNMRTQRKCRRKETPAAGRHGNYWDAWGKKKKQQNITNRLSSKPIISKTSKEALDWPGRGETINKSVQTCWLTVWRSTVNTADDVDHVSTRGTRLENVLCKAKKEVLSEDMMVCLYVKSEGTFL